MTKKKPDCSGVSFLSSIPGLVEPWIRAEFCHDVSIFEEKSVLFFANVAAITVFCIQREYSAVAERLWPATGHRSVSHVALERLSSP